MMTTNTPPDAHHRIIRASEVGAFSYCARAWWLGSVQGLRPDDVRPFQAGQSAHERHGRRVLLGILLMRLAYFLLLLAGIVGAGWLVSLLAA
jgi:hypothetical protein